MKVDFRQKEYLIKDIKGLTEKVCLLSGFEPEKLIYKGEVRREDWIGSLVYQGSHKNKSTILKIQGLRPEQEEPDIMQSFMNQNKSKLIRTPYIFWHHPWNIKDKFGAFIMENVKAPQIFNYPYASQKQKNLFKDFYEEFHLNALKKPWEKAFKDELTNVQFFKKRLERLKKERLDIKLPKEDKERINLFSNLVDKEMLSFPLVFTHGHLGAEDIRFDGKQYVIMSNLAWGYKLEFYDLVFIIWGCLHKIRDKNLTLEKAQKLIDEWFNTYKKSLYLKKHKDLKIKTQYCLLYFILSSIVLQLYSDEHKKTASKEELNNLFYVHRQLFDKLYRDMV